MLNTNLLPQEEKRLVWFEETRRIVLFFTLFITTIFITASVLLLPSFLAFYLGGREPKRSIEIEEGAAQKLKVHETLKSSQKANSSIQTIKKLASGPSKASSLFENLLDTAAPYIILNNVGVKKTGEVALSGIAPTRLDLLNFEKELRGSGIFQEISSPLSNIIREANINFIMQGKFKPKSDL